MRDILGELIVERNELALKVSKLEAFLAQKDGEKSAEEIVGLYQAKILHKQLSAMSFYVECLNSRIGDLN